MTLGVDAFNSLQLSGVNGHPKTMEEILLLLHLVKPIRIPHVAFDEISSRRIPLALASGLCNPYPLQNSLR